MQRKQFIRNSILAGTGLLATEVAGASVVKKNDPPVSGKPFRMNYGIHDGLFKNNAGKDFIDQIKFAYDIGFRAIEDNGMAARPVEQQKAIGDILAKLGMAMGVFVLDKGGNGAIASAKTFINEPWLFNDKCSIASSTVYRCLPPASGFNVNSEVAKPNRTMPRSSDAATPATSWRTVADEEMCSSSIEAKKLSSQMMVASVVARRSVSLTIN